MRHGLLLVDTAATVKLFSREAAAKVTRDAMQILPGTGLMRESPVCRSHRDALVCDVIGEGTSRIQQSLITRAVGDLGGSRR